MILFFLYDETIGQQKTHNLVDGLLDLLKQAIEWSNSAFVRPFSPALPNESAAHAPGCGLDLRVRKVPIPVNAAKFELRIRGGAMTSNQEPRTHWYPASVAEKAALCLVVLGPRRVRQPQGLLENYESLSRGWNSARSHRRFVSHSVGLLGGNGACGNRSAPAGLFALRSVSHARPSRSSLRPPAGGVGRRKRREANVADLHIGTYRHAFLLSDVLPQATIQSVDCWNVEGESPEEAVQDVRDLEVPPASNPRIVPSKANLFTVPLEDASCDAVCFGFGTHEIPVGGAREKLFSEATRILKPGGKVLLFEHGWDAHNYVIFGPVIHHVTKRQDWDKFLRERFDGREVCTQHAGC